LLGPNGAGKSSTFNLLAMNGQRSDGECRVASTDIDKLDVWQQNLMMGMCPQHNTFSDHLTVQQTLRFIAEVKGLSEDDIEFQT
jgi:ABC-type multidrug transport system ATPase subunit